MKLSIRLLTILVVQAYVSSAFANQTKAEVPSRTVNILASPLSLSGTTLQADFAVSEKSTVGPILAMTTYSGSNSASGFSAGASYNHMFSANVFNDGWSVNSTLLYSQAKASSGSSVSGYFLGAMAQNNWFWENGFNANLGIGLQYASLDLSAIGLPKIAGILPNFGLNVGYAF